MRGRKKEVIVTPEGLNVFPEDVERAINDLGGVRESAVVGMAAGGEERAHAVLVLEPGIEPGEIVRQANARLEDHQKIRGVSVWSAGELPRTEGTKKLKRRDIRWWVEAGESRAADARAPRDTVEAIVGQFAGRRAVTGETTLDELGLSSLERLELMMALEEYLETSIDEMSFAGAAKVSDLRALVERPPGAETTAAAAAFPFQPGIEVGSLGRSPGKPIDVDPSACARVCLGTYRRIDESGLDRGPCPVRGEPPEPLGHSGHPRRAPDARTLPGSPRHGQGVFQGALPSEQHTRREWLTSSLNYYLAALFFNAFPLPQREAGTWQALRYIGELVSDGLSVLIFPEGRRTDMGRSARSYLASG